MSIADIRNAFVEAGKGQLHCTQARLRYANDGNNSQIVEFDGHYADGKPFSIASEPFDGRQAPQIMAREVAGKMLRPLAQPPQPSTVT